MARCNIFKPLSKYTGEFYTFSQYTSDLTKESALKTEYRVVPSKFAVLNIDANNIKDDKNINIANYFQCMYENSVAVLRDELSDYNPNIASQLFWKMMNASTLLNLEQYSEDTKIYSEIKYIGDINIYNNQDTDGMNYNEIYCYIPSSEPSYYYPLYNTNTDPKSYPYTSTYIKGWNNNNWPSNLTTSNKPLYHSGNSYYLNNEYIPYELIWNNFKEPTQSKIKVNQYYSQVEINIKEYINDIVGETNTLYYDADCTNPVDEYTNIILSSDKPSIKLYSKIPLKYIEQDGKQIQSVENVKFTLGDNYIEFYTNTDHYYEFNSIVLFYDIYNNSSSDNPTILYKNIPLGIYFTGCIENGNFTNPVKKFVSNDDIFGQGSSYGLRICTKMSSVPSSDWYETEVNRADNDFSGITSVMSKLSELLDSYQTNIDSNKELNQNIKDHLAMFKNYRVNVPYIRKVNGKDTWFVNGRNTEINV